MYLRRYLLLPVALMVALASLPASGEVYKWVDERGVTNYSNDPPSALKAANKVALVPDRISVYSPDKNLTDAVAAFRQQINSSRGSDIVRQDADRLAYQRAAAAQSAQASPCSDYNGGNCSGTATDYYPAYPYFPVIAAAPRQNRPRAVGSFVNHPMHAGLGNRGLPIR
jgi:hypothetical protein